MLVLVEIIHHQRSVSNNKIQTGRQVLLDLDKLLLDIRALKYL
uniref:Uncharacterized protein n=1 Tax=Heterorhabditis bacteriophora TaxID=37862 RepID=A0A1I7X0Z3_HETBA